MRGNRSELTPGRKSPRCHVNTPWLTADIWRPLPLVFPPNDLWETSAEFPYWCVTTQIWLVLLIGRAEWEIWFNQSEALTISGCDASSVWNFCAPFSDVIWRVGSITSRCSGKWARIHPPFGKDQRPDPWDGGNRAYLAGKPVVVSPNVGCFLRLHGARWKGLSKNTNSFPKCWSN